MNFFEYNTKIEKMISFRSNLYYRDKFKNQNLNKLFKNILFIKLKYLKIKLSLTYEQNKIQFNN